MGNCYFCCHPTKKLVNIAVKNKALLPVVGKMTVDELHQLLATSELVISRKGDILVTEGDFVDELYIVTKGSFTLTSAGNIVSVATKGDCFGMSSFLNGEPHAYTATANRFCVAYRLNRSTFDKIMLDVEKHFENVELLNIVSKSDRQLIYDQAKLVEFEKGEMVVIKGERANQFYVILEGRVSTENESLGKGKCFGEDALIENNEVYFSDVEVEENVILLALSAEGFLSPQFTAVRASLEDQVKRKRRRRQRQLKSSLTSQSGFSSSIGDASSFLGSIFASMLEYVRAAVPADDPFYRDVTVEVKDDNSDSPVPIMESGFAAFDGMASHVASVAQNPSHHIMHAAPGLQPGTGRLVIQGVADQTADKVKQVSQQAFNQLPPQPPGSLFKYVREF